MFLHVYPFVCVSLHGCMTLFNLFIQCIWHGIKGSTTEQSVLSVLSVLSVTAKVHSVIVKADVKYRWSCMDTAEALYRKIPRIKRWNSIANNIMSHLWSTDWEKTAVCKKEVQEEICGDDRFSDILSCITYKHTPTHTKKHRHIIHTAWAALWVNFS